MDAVDELAKKFETFGAVTIALEDGGVFKVQKGLLCSNSEYFKRALEGDFLESETQTLTLPGCSTNTFKLLLYWLCHHQLPKVGDAEEESLLELEKGFASLWILGDMLALPEIQNKAMRRLEFISRFAPPSPETVQIIFENTAWDSILRDYITRKVLRGWYESATDQMYTEAAQEELEVIPGFTRALMDKVKHCFEKCNHGDHYPYISSNDIKKYYLVPSGQKKQAGES